MVDLEANLKKAEKSKDEQAIAQARQAIVDEHANRLNQLQEIVDHNAKAQQAQQEISQLQPDQATFVSAALKAHAQEDR